MNNRSRKEIELRILIILDSSGACNMNMIRYRINTDDCTFKEAMQNLRDKRFISIEKTEKAHIINLTDKGVSLIPAAKSLL